MASLPRFQVTEKITLRTAALEDSEQSLSYIKQTQQVCGSQAQAAEVSILRPGEFSLLG